MPRSYRPRPLLHLATFRASRSPYYCWCTWARCRPWAPRNVQVVALPLLPNLRPGRRGRAHARNVQGVALPLPPGEGLIYAIRDPVLATFRTSRFPCYHHHGAQPGHIRHLATFRASRSPCHRGELARHLTIPLLATFRASRSPCHPAARSQYTFPVFSQRSGRRAPPATLGTCGFCGCGNHLATFRASRSPCHPLNWVCTNSSKASRNVQGVALPLLLARAGPGVSLPRLLATFRASRSPCHTRRSGGGRIVAKTRNVQGVALPLLPGSGIAPIAS